MARIPEPLCQTSANLSGHPDAGSATAAASDLAGSPDVAVEAGRLPPGARASTVVDATGETPVILRQGALVVEEAAGR